MRIFGNRKAGKAPYAYRNTLGSIGILRNWEAGKAPYAYRNSLGSMGILGNFEGNKAASGSHTSELVGI